MSRLVRPERIVVRPIPEAGIALEGVGEGGRAQAAGQDIRERGDTYLERVAKYVPAEIVAFFIFADSIVRQSKLDKQAYMASFSVEHVGLAIFLIAWICVPFYLRRVSEPGDAFGVNAAMATLLFPVWAYAVQGTGVTSFVSYDGHLASIVLGGCSLLSGLAEPRARANGSSD